MLQVGQWVPLSFTWAASEEVLQIPMAQVTAPTSSIRTSKDSHGWFQHGVRPLRTVRPIARFKQVRRVILKLPTCLLRSYQEGANHRQMAVNWEAASLLGQHGVTPATGHWALISGLSTHGHGGVWAGVWTTGKQRGRPILDSSLL